MIILSPEHTPNKLQQIGIKNSIIIFIFESALPTHIEKRSVPFDRASYKAQSMDFSKAFILLVVL